jgi:hypothetical protein
MVGSSKPVNFEVRNQMHAELTLLNFPRTLTALEKSKRPEPKFNQNHFA